MCNSTREWRLNSRLYIAKYTSDLFSQGCGLHVHQSIIPFISINFHKKSQYGTF
jgi:hypothetical protein